MINWGWRTKPRSILKTIEWLKFLKNLKEKSGMKQMEK